MVEEQAAGAIIKEVLSVLRIGEEEFMDRYRTLAADPRTAGLVQAAEQGVLSASAESDTPPALSKEKLLEVLEVHMEFDLKAE